MDETNPLRQYFVANQKRQIYKWLHYFDVYHRHFAIFRDRAVTVLEIGVAHGGSLQMWRHYFGESARIVGIDTDSRCLVVQEDRIHVRIGSQSDPKFLLDVANEFGPVDVVIDDGGHRMEQMHTAFEVLYPCVAANGVYLVEDLHACYLPEYGGGLGVQESFVEKAKALIDQLNGWHKNAASSADEFTRSTTSLHFYDSVVVFEKGIHNKPSHAKTGNESF